MLQECVVQSEAESSQLLHVVSRVHVVGVLYFGFRVGSDSVCSRRPHLLEGKTIESAALGVVGLECQDSGSGLFVVSFLLRIGKAVPGFVESIFERPFLFLQESKLLARQEVIIGLLSLLGSFGVCLLHMVEVPATSFATIVHENLDSTL